MNQTLRSGSSLDSDLAKGSNQSIMVSARGWKQAPYGNMSLNAL